MPKILEFFSAPKVVVPIFIIVAVVLPFWFSSFDEGFWSGYRVEIAGISVEVLFVYLAVDLLLKHNQKKKESKLRRPIFSMMMEYVELFQVRAFQSIDILIQTVEKQEKDPHYTKELYVFYTPDYLKKQQNAIQSYLMHASNHIDTETYTKILGYIDYTDNLISLVRFLQFYTTSKLNSDNSEISFPAKEISAKHQIRKEAFTESEGFLEWLKNRSDLSEKLFFQADIIKNSIAERPAARNLLVKVEEVDYIVLK